jgi:membrane-bound ClpP family serine protease
MTSTVSKERKVIVSINGAIAEGDADKLNAIIKSANDSGRLVSGIRLNSPGGLHHGLITHSALVHTRLAQVGCRSI